MAAIDCSKFPESTWLSLLAASYRMVEKMFQDPKVKAEYEEWLSKKNAAAAAK